MTINQPGMRHYHVPTGFLPAEILASLTRVMMAATVGTDPEVPLSIEIEPLSMSRNEFLKGQIKKYTLILVKFPHALAVRSGYARYDKKDQFSLQAWHTSGYVMHVLTPPELKFFRFENARGSFLDNEFK